jgi:hypothetical protein
VAAILAMGRAMLGAKPPVKSFWETDDAAGVEAEAEAAA